MFAAANAKSKNESQGPQGVGKKKSLQGFYQNGIFPHRKSLHISLIWISLSIFCPNYDQDSRFYCSVFSTEQCEFFMLQECSAER